MSGNAFGRTRVILCAILILVQISVPKPIQSQHWITPQGNGYPNFIDRLLGTYGYNSQGDVFKPSKFPPRENDWYHTVPGTVKGLREFTSDFRNAVGEQGAIWRLDFDHDTYTPLTAVTGANLNSVCYINTNGANQRIFAAGERGTVVSCYPQLNTSTVLTENQFPDLHAIWQLDSRNIWAVGDSGCVVISSDQGKSWTERRRSPAYRFTRLSMRSANMILIAGSDAQSGSGLLIRTNREMSEWTEYRFGGHSAVTDIEVYKNWVILCGTEGLLQRSIDSARTWQPYEQGTRISFTDISGPGKEILAVGVSAVDGHFRCLASTDSGKTWSGRYEAEDSIGTLHVSRRQMPPSLVVSEDGKVWHHEDRYTEPTLRLVMQVPHPLYACAVVYYDNWIVGGKDGRLFLSEDEGRNWRSTEALDSDVITLETNRKDSLFALTRGGRFYRSADHGVSWRLIYAFPSGMSIERISVENGDTCLAIGEEGAQGLVCLSTDGGYNWRTVLRFPARVSGAAVDSSGALFVTTLDGKLLGCAESDATWDTLYETRGENLLDVVVPSRAEIHLLVNGDIVLYSRDRGKSWERAFFKDQHFTRIAAYPRRGSWMAWGKESSLLTVLSGNKSITSVRRNWPTLNAAASRYGWDFVAVGEGGTILQYTWTWSYQWEIKQIPVQLPIDLRDVVWLDETDLVAVGDSGLIMKGSAAGVQWTIAYRDPAKRPLTQTFGFPSGSAVAAGEHILLRSPAGGAGWTESAAYPGIRLAPVDDRMWYCVSTGGNVYLTEDAGQTWRHHGTLPNPAVELGAFSGDNLMALSVSGEGQQFRSVVYRSTDFAASWTVVLETSEEIHRMRLFDGSRVILTANGGKVWIGDNYGRTWTETRSRFGTTFCDVELVDRMSAQYPEYLFISNERMIDILLLAKPVLSAPRPPEVPSSLKITGLYPNPASRLLTVHASGTTRCSNRLSLHNLLGQEVWNGNLADMPGGSWQRTIDISRAAEGIYMLRLTGEDGGSDSRMVVIRR